MNIGFIGLGHMGLPMAIHLLESGHNVTGFDLSPAALETFQTSGGNIATTLKAVAQNEVIITMLQTGKQVRSVCISEDGILTNNNIVKLYIDCSSIDVDTSKLLHQKAQERNILMLDAPVSGGVAGAEAKTLTFMVGGSDEAFKAGEPILELMGKKIIHTGGAGSGQAAKICNNMILAINMIGISEAFVLGEKLGLNPKKLHEVVINSSGQCWAMSKYVPVAGILDNVPANKNYQPGFTAAMMLKDLNLSQDAAKSVNVKIPLGTLATEMYQNLNDKQLGALDFSAIIKLIQNFK